MIQYNDLDIKAQLNMYANSIATSTTPINTHAIVLLFAMYIDHKYTYHRHNHSIRVTSHKHEVQLFLQKTT